MPVFEIKLGKEAEGNRALSRVVLGMMARKRPLPAVLVLSLLILGACEIGQSDPSPEVRSSTPRVGPSPPDTDNPDAEGTTGVPNQRADSSTFLVWAPGGLKDSALRAVTAAEGVKHAPVITGGIVWMTGSSRGKQPPAGYSFPLEVAFVPRSAFAQVMPQGETIPRLDDGEAVIAETAYALRGEPAVPFSIDTDQGALRVIGMVADETSAGFELIAGGSAPQGWGARYTVAAGEVSARDIRRAVAPHVDGPFRVRRSSDTPFLRHADAVHPPMLLKERFGEFAARPLPDGRLDVDKAWRDRNIVEKEVPVLGRITCHRLFLEQIEQALGDAQRKGLAREIDPGGYAGCYSARFILSDPSGRLSSHAWGAAFDINAPGNAYGAEPTMDRRLVRHMEEWGLFWGGRWMIPDGMHFEWARFLD